MSTTKQEHIDDFIESPQSGMSEEARIYREMGELAYNARDIIEKIDCEFEAATQLNKSDLAFMMFATGLQLVRQYMLTNFPDRLAHDEAAKKVKGTTHAKSGLQNNLLNPSLEEIIRNPVPFDITRYTDDYKSLVKEMGGKRILQGGGARGHRVSTLGHDPLLGLVFGTANISTSTITNYQFQSCHVVSRPTPQGKMANQIGTSVALRDIFVSVEGKLLNEGMTGKAKLVASLVKEVEHLKSDINTKNSLPFPGTSINPALANKLADYGLDAQNVAVVSKQAIYAQFINMIIAVLHGLYYYVEIGEAEQLLSLENCQRAISRKADSEEALKLHKVRTAKIISYSNLIASSSNIGYVALSKNITKLDIGGFAVAIYKLIQNEKFIDSVKREFIENRWNEKFIERGENNMSSKDFKAGIEVGARPFSERFEAKAQEAGAPDTELEDFPGCRALIHSRVFNIFPDEQATKWQASNQRRMEKFRTKYLSMIAPQTIVDYASVGSNDFLFTTWGLHVRLSGKKGIDSIAYDSIDIKNNIIKFDKSGTACGYSICKKYSNDTIDLIFNGSQTKHVNWSELDDLLRELKNCTTSSRDIPQSIFALDGEVKYAYGETLLAFCSRCNIGTIEALRMAYELNMGAVKFGSLIHASTQKYEDKQFEDKVHELLDGVPYPSKGSIINELMQNIVAVWQHETGKVREFSSDADRCLRIIAKFAVSMPAYGKPQYTISEMNEAADKLYKNIIPGAQISYRMIQNDISAAEVELLQTAMFSVIGGAGFPLATVGVSSFLWSNIWWFTFIPGVGTIALTAAIGATAAAVITSTLKKDEPDKRQLLLNEEAKSYESFARYIRSMPESEFQQGFKDALRISANRTDESLHAAVTDIFKVQNTIVPV